MTRHIFPYGIRLREDDKIEVFPAAELSIKGRGTRGIHATFHIDSGATISILPGSDAKALGISLNTGEKLIVRSVSGESLHGYRHSITLLFEVGHIKVPVVFVENTIVPRILGREGLFPHFAIIFDEAKRRVAFLDHR